MTAWSVAPVAWSQTVPPQIAATEQTATESAASQPNAAQSSEAPPKDVHAGVARSNAAQENAGGPNAGQPSVPGAAATGDKGVTQNARHSSPRHGRSPGTDDAAQERGGASAGKSDGVLALGATDITGNKELPKVMVIVPWKDSTGAGGVIAPTDSLMDEALQPVDRGVFQRRIRYYGQLNAAGEGSPASKVAPVGDSH
jgi:hypothetical protein